MNEKNSQYETHAELTDKHCIIMQFILGYLLAEKYLQTADLYKKLGIDNASLTKLRRTIGYGDVSLFLKLFNYLREVVVARRTWEKFPELREPIRELFASDRPIDELQLDRQPEQLQRSSTTEVEKRLVRYFLKEALKDDAKGKGFLANFEGNYRVIRYATSSDEHDTPRIIVAAAKVESKSTFSPFPRCTLHFPSREKVPSEDLPQTRGMLIPFKNHVFMIGQDKDADYPAIIVFPNRGVKIHEVSGIVLRRHIDGFMISARCRFIRHEPAADKEDRTYDELLSEVGIYAEDDSFIEAHLKEFLDRILNKVPLVGKGTLRLSA